MLDWQIAVLVVICVVFVIVAALLLFLLWRISRKPTTTMKGGGSIGSQGAATRYCGLTPSDTVLHFVDFNDLAKSIDFAAHPELTSGAALQTYIAVLCGGLDDPESLSLDYLSDSGAIVVMDLDRLITQDAEFAARMRHTAERPLQLSRLVDVGGPTVTALPTDAPLSLEQTGANGGTASVTNPLVGVASTSNQLDVALSMRYPAHTLPSSTSRAGALALTNVEDGGSRGIRRLPALEGDGSHSPGPVPRIFPTSSTITPNTPVCIMAATYTVRHLDGTTHVLDDATTAVLEAAMCGDSTSRTIRVERGEYHGCVFLVHPERGEATLRAPGMVDCTVVRRRAEGVQYTVDRTNSTQWRTFNRPFFLPPGRWCVRARATSASTTHSPSTAKVYTVTATNANASSLLDDDGGLL